MDEPATADRTYVLRLWMERGDDVLRGRVLDDWVPDRGATGRECAGGSTARRGVDAIADVLHECLRATEAELREQLG